MANYKVAIYTAITGGYEKAINLSHVNKNFDYYLFVENDVLNYAHNSWNVIKINNIDNLDSVRLARKIKILGHSILKSYDYTIWIDGNVDIISDVSELFHVYRNYDLITFKHPNRNCIYEEADACINYMKDDNNIIHRQLEYYDQIGYPRNNGLAETNVIIRRNTPVLDIAMEEWWRMISQFSKRDQLSFNYVMDKFDIKFSYMEEQNARGHSNFFHVKKDHEFLRKIKYKYKLILRNIFGI